VKSNVNESGRQTVLSYTVDRIVEISIKLFQFFKKMYLLHYELTS